MNTRRIFQYIICLPAFVFLAPQLSAQAISPFIVETDTAPDNLYTPRQDWFAAYLEDMNEPVLTPDGKGKDYFAFRMLYLPPEWVGGPIVVRFEKNGAKIIRRAVRIPNKREREQGINTSDKTDEMTNQDFMDLSEQINRCAFDKMPATDDVSGLDGSNLIVEQIKDGKYTLITRWAPEIRTQKRGLCSAWLLARRVFQDAGFWKKQECAFSRGAPVVSVRETLSKLRVGKIDETLPANGFHGENAFLYERFIKNCQDRYIMTVDKGSWDNAGQLLTSALMEKAVNEKLDAVSLKSCLARFKKNGENAGECMMALPVAAYLGAYSKGKCWIFVCRWGTPKSDADKALLLDHIGVWALDAQSTDYVDYATCD